jgi:hypothetical protein
MCNFTSGSRAGKGPGDPVDAREQLLNKMPGPWGGPVFRSEALDLRAHIERSPSKYRETIIPSDSPATTPYQGGSLRYVKTGRSRRIPH